MGPAETYAHLSDSAKWVLSVTTLVGSMEFYTALVLLKAWVPFPRSISNGNWVRFPQKRWIG